VFRSVKNYSKLYNSIKNESLSLDIIPNDKLILNNYFFNSVENHGVVVKKKEYFSLYNLKNKDVLLVAKYKSNSKADFVKNYRFKKIGYCDYRSDDVYSQVEFLKGVFINSEKENLTNYKYIFYNGKGINLLKRSEDTLFFSGSLNLINLSNLNNGYNLGFNIQEDVNYQNEILFVNKDNDVYMIILFSYNKNNHLKYYLINKKETSR
jgi:hypothetical protein